MSADLDAIARYDAIGYDPGMRPMHEGQWVQPDYANRFLLPKDFMADIWKLVDHEKIKTAMVARIEQEMADRIVNHLAAELATDVKQILSNSERREELRAVARENMDRICSPNVKDQPRPENDKTK